MKLGLKLWSTNRNYQESALRLFEEGVFDYIELYIVPHSFKDYADGWKGLSIPIDLHVSHESHGFNLSLKSKERGNQDLFAEAVKFANFLGSEYMVVHPGSGGKVQESIRQIMQLADKRVVIENMPKCHSQFKSCFVGAKLEEIQEMIIETRLSLCLDVGHAVCASNSLGLIPFEYLKNLSSLKPSVVHISDGDFQGVKDVHYHLEEGDFPLNLIVPKLKCTEKICLETPKNQVDSLEDFKLDAMILRRHIKHSNGKK